MLDAAFIKATTYLGVLDAASIKATTCQESWMPPPTQNTTQLINSWNTQECQVPLQANNVGYCLLHQDVCALSLPGGIVLNFNFSN